MGAAVGRDGSATWGSTRTGVFQPSNHGALEYESIQPRSSVRPRSAAWWRALSST